MPIILTNVTVYVNVAGVVISGDSVLIAWNTGVAAVDPDSGDADWALHSANLSYSPLLNLNPGQSITFDGTTYTTPPSGPLCLTEGNLYVNCTNSTTEVSGIAVIQ